MDFIFIEALRVKSRVGIYPRERVTEQTLELNLTFGVPDAAAEHDDIADTIDYAKVIERIREELGKRQFNLIETLGEFIFCTDEEQRAINEQRVNYEYLWRILEAVRPDEGSG